MQINLFGLPLGAGMQSASANGAASLGFADALGLAIGGSTAQPRTGLIASATPPAHFGPKLAQNLLEQAQLAAQVLPKAAAGILPGLQQPTSLSELMATAARLPGADQLPATAATTTTTTTTTTVPVPDIDAQLGPMPVGVDAIAVPLEIAPPPAAAPESVAAAVALPVAGPETGTPSAAAPAAETIPPGAVPVAAVPAQDDAALPPESDALPRDTAPAAPSGPAPSKPLKNPPRVTTADPDLVPSDGTQPAVPAEMLAINAVPQPVVPQQSAPRDPSANAHGGSAVSKTGKVAAQSTPAQDAAQPAFGTGTGTTADFARAVATKGESAGSQSNPDGQPQPEAAPAIAAKIDAAAPILPQQTAATAAADPARATAPAPAPAEPVIEARAGHLGQSLGVEIARKVELGEETLRIRLNPVELGRIEVTLAFDDKGSLQATVRTESAQAMDLLRQDVPDLARTLDQAGVRTDAQSFRFENRSGDGGGQQAQQQQAQNRGRFASSEDDAAIAEPIYRPIRSDGQVDLLA